MTDSGRARPIRHDGTTIAAREVWSAVGAAFFRELANHLSAALGARLVYIGQFCAEPVARMAALAVSRNGADAEPHDYHISETASAELFTHGNVFYERDVRRTFPSDPILEKESAEAFAGKTLFDSRAQPIGAIVALWRHPVTDSSAARAMFEVFAPRAAAELERKRTEDDLRQSEQRYRAFILDNRDAMFRLEFEQPIPTDLPEDEQIDRMYRYGYVAECNDATARIAGAPSCDALIGARLEQITPRTEAQAEDFRNVIRSGYKGDDVEVRRPDKDGRASYRLRSQSGTVYKGKLLRVWVTVRDMTELKRVEFEWQASERRFRQLLENIQMAAVMLDTEARVTFCNDYLLAITGWSREDLLGGNWFELIIPDEDRDRLGSLFLNHLAGGAPHYHFEAPILRRDGARRLMEWDRTVLRSAEGEVIGAASMGKDITAQKLLEARLREADKLYSLRRLAGAIAHDFNNLLMVISASGERLVGAHGSGPERRAAEHVISASEQGAALTRQLLDFSRDVPVIPRPVQLDKLITESAGMLRAVLGRNIELVWNLETSPGTVLADSGQMHQVLVNLTINARDAMPQGGKLIITLQQIEVSEVAPPGMPEVHPGAYVQLDVADTGSGMPEDIRTHVFEPFFTTKRERGTGLGLASVYGIVRQSGGYISVDSTPGKGSTFHILLPALAGSEDKRPE